MATHFSERAYPVLVTREIVRHVESHSCRLLREGGKHSVYYNPENNRTSAIARYREINEFLDRKICRDLGVPEP